MQPNRIGRVLGIGARVAGARLREQAERLGSAPQNPPPPAPAAGADLPRSAAPPTAPPRPAAPKSTTSGRDAAAQMAENSRRYARGAGRFGSALVKPFAHATSVLWHEIAGMFFALFATFFFEHAWFVWKAQRLRDQHLWVYAGLGLLFAWFTVSSFWRARRRQRRGQ